MKNVSTATIQLVTDFTAANVRDMVEIFLFENPIEGLLGKNIICEIISENGQVFISKVKTFKSRYKFYTALNKTKWPVLVVVTHHEIQVVYTSNQEALRYYFNPKSKHLISCKYIDRIKDGFFGKTKPVDPQDVLKGLHQIVVANLKKSA